MSTVYIQGLFPGHSYQLILWAAIVHVMTNFYVLRGYWPINDRRLCSGSVSRSQLPVPRVRGQRDWWLWLCDQWNCADYRGFSSRKVCSMVNLYFICINHMGYMAFLQPAEKHLDVYFSKYTNLCQNLSNTSI